MGGGGGLGRGLGHLKKPQWRARGDLGEALGTQRGHNGGQEGTLGEHLTALGSLGGTLGGLGGLGYF